MNSTTDLIPYGPVEQAGIETEIIAVSVEESNYSTANRSLLKGLIIGTASILIVGFIVYRFWLKQVKENDNYTTYAGLI